MARKTPILLRRGPVSGRVQALYRYTFADDGQTLKAAMDGKQDVHDDFEPLALAWLMDDGAEDIVSVLDGAADGEPLSDDQRAQVRVVRERIREACEAHNARSGHNLEAASSEAKGVREAMRPAPTPVPPIGGVRAATPPPSSAECCCPDPRDPAEDCPAHRHRRAAGLTAAHPDDISLPNGPLRFTSRNDEQATCGRLLVGQGDDTYDPCCGLPERHDGACRP